MQGAADWAGDRQNTGDKQRCHNRQKDEWVLEKVHRARGPHCTNYAKRGSTYLAAVSLDTNRELFQVTVPN